MCSQSYRSFTQPLSVPRFVPIHSSGESGKQLCEKEKTSRFSNSNSSYSNGIHCNKSSKDFVLGALRGIVVINLPHHTWYPHGPTQSRVLWVFLDLSHWTNTPYCSFLPLLWGNSNLHFWIRRLQGKHVVSGHDLNLLTSKIASHFQCCFPELPAPEISINSFESHN